jgi:L-fuconate dehydratase
MVQHLQMWDFIALNGTTENRFIEYVDQQHEHFESPAIIRNACYMPPSDPGYSTKLTDKTLLNYMYPNGKEWQYMFNEGIYPAPSI